MAGTATKTLSKDKLAKELLELRKKYAPFEPRDKELCSQLKAIAADEGGNYKVTCGPLGVVKVSAPKEKTVTGKTYELDVGTFLALPEKQRERDLERGVVKETETHSGPYYGAVTVELF